MGTKIIDGDLLVTGELLTEKLDLSTKLNQLSYGKHYEVSWDQRLTIDKICLVKYGSLYLQIHTSTASATIRLTDYNLTLENTVEEALAIANNLTDIAWVYNVNADDVGYYSSKYETDNVSSALYNIEGELVSKTNTSVLPNDNGDIKTKYRISKKATNNSKTDWVYYKICTLPVSDNANYASVIVSGRIGGWGTDSIGYINAVLGNRHASGISVINIATPSVLSLRAVYDKVDIVMYQNSDNTVTVYLKCGYYWVFDLDFEFFQSNITVDYDGNYISTTPEGTLVAKASTSKQKVEVLDGDLLVNGKSLVSAADSLDNKVDKVEQHTIDSIFNSRIAASDSTGSKYEIQNGSVAYPVKIGGMSSASKNILNIPDQEEITKTLSGGHTVTYSVKDGAVTVKSVENPNGTYHGFGVDIDLTPSLIRGKTYYYKNMAETYNSGDTEAVTINIKITYTTESGKSTSYLGFPKLSSTTKRSFTFDNTVKSVNMYMQCANIVSSDTNRVFKPMITLGDNITEFEPYHSDIRATQVTGIRSVGQNLLNFENIYKSNYAIAETIDNGIRVTSQSAATETDKVYTNVSYFIPKKLLKIGETYKISANMTPNSTNTPRIYLTYRDKDFNDLAYAVNLSQTGSANFKVSSTLDFEYILVTIYANSGGICKVNDYVDYTNVYFGLADGEYQPYWEDTLHISEEIQALTGYGLGINREYCNYIDFIRKVFVQQVSEQILTESDVADFGLSGSVGTYNRFAVSGWAPSKVKQSKEIVLEGYPWDRNYAGDYCHAYIEGNCLFIFDNAATVDELKAKFIGKKLIYPLGTPVETDISEYLVETSYKVDNLGTEIVLSDSNKKIPTIVKYNVAVNDQVIENSENIAKIKTELTNYATQSWVEEKLNSNELKTLTIEQTTSDILKDIAYYAHSQNKAGIYFVNNSYIAVAKYGWLDYYLVQIMDFNGNFYCTTYYSMSDLPIAQNIEVNEVTTIEDKYTILKALKVDGGTEIGINEGYYIGTSTPIQLYYTATENSQAVNKWYVDNAIATSCITATETQTLTDDQKSTARQNIGAIGGTFENGVLTLFIE